jgi:CRISPR-associated exonuclease Cas4
MEPYLCITQLNDFTFCPRSIYFANIHKQNYSPETYHKMPQKVGLAAHEAVDNGKYSARKDILQGLTVYSEKYRLLGKIDTLDLHKKELCERKYSVSAIYDGFHYQIYAQYFALLEMGYKVDSLKIYSKKDNKNYQIKCPGKNEIHEFDMLIDNIRSFSLYDSFSQSQLKCKKCIYNPLCDYYEEEELR